MAYLETEGYVVQPHTSAGRIPSDCGYRYFVDHYADSASLTSSLYSATSTTLAISSQLSAVSTFVASSLRGCIYAIVIILFAPVARA